MRLHLVPEAGIEPAFHALGTLSQRPSDPLILLVPRYYHPGASDLAKKLG